MRKRNVVGVLITAAALVPVVQGASATWNGTTVGSWSSTTNWITSPVPGINDTATFNNAVNNQTTISPGTLSINNITFDTANAASYTFSGGTITLKNVGGVTESASVVNNQNIGSALQLGTAGGAGVSFSLTNSSPLATLSLTGNITPASVLLPGAAVTAAGSGYGVSQTGIPVSASGGGGSGLVGTATSNASGAINAVTITNAGSGYTSSPSLVIGGTGTGATATLTAAAILNLQGQGTINISGNIADLDGTRTLTLKSARAGTTILSGANTFTGLSSATDGCLMVGKGGTVILDYATNTSILPSTSIINLGDGGGGTLVFRGNSGVSTTTTQTVGNLVIGPSGNTIVVDKNGGAGTTVTLGNSWSNYTGSSRGGVYFDLSSGGVAQLSSTAFSGGSYSKTNNVINGNGRASVTVKDTDGKVYFATLDGSTPNAKIVAQKTLNTLAAGTGNDAFHNYQMIGNVTVTAGTPLSVNSLWIDPTSAKTLDLNGTAMTITAKSVLKDGAFDSTIINGTFATEADFIVYGAGKLTVGATQGGARDIYKFGTGVLELTGNNNASCTGTTRVMDGTLRAGAASVLSSGAVYLASSTLEVGYDFTRALGTSAGQLSGAGSMGFSAYGANHYVNLGGASASITFGASSFVTSRDAKLMLSSATSDSTIDFQNPLNLNGDAQTVEVANGTAAVDAILSGTLTNGSLIKSGAGTLKTTAANTYAGDTVISAGRLLVGGTNSGQGNYRIAADATLGGSGTIGLASGKSITIMGTSGHNGILSPGESAGTLTVTGDVVLGDYSTLAIEINGDSKDLLAITGNLDLSSLQDNLALSLTGTQSQSRYVFATYTGTLTGTFTNWSGLPGGASLDYTTLHEVAVVIPEPASISLALGVASMGLLGRRRRVHKS